MMIDVLDKTHFRIFEDNLSQAFATMHKEIQYLKGLVFQLQDRIKMLETQKQ